MDPAWHSWGDPDNNARSIRRDLLRAMPLCACISAFGIGVLGPPDSVQPNSTAAAVCARHIGWGRRHNNYLQVILYGNQYYGRGHCTGLRLGDPGSQRIVHNRIELSLHAPRGTYFDDAQKRFVEPEEFVPEQAIGAHIFAQGNALTPTCYGTRHPGHDLVFEADARDNVVFAFSLPNGITSRAAVTTNRVVPTWQVGFDVATPEAPPPGEPVVNRNPCVVQVLILSPGAVMRWSLTPPARTQHSVPYNLSLVDHLRRQPPPIPPPEPPTSQTIEAGLAAGQTILLGPGESLKIDYTQPPSWIWKALV